MTPGWTSSSLASPCSPLKGSDAGLFFLFLSLFRFYCAEDGPRSRNTLFLYWDFGRFPGDGIHTPSVGWDERLVRASTTQPATLPLERLFKKHRRTECWKRLAGNLWRGVYYQCSARNKVWRHGLDLCLQMAISCCALAGTNG